MLANSVKVCLLAALSSMAEADNYKVDGEKDVRLRFNSNNKFKILQLTDIQMGENPELDNMTLDMIEEILTKERPDLVAITGDMVSGQAMPKHDKSNSWWRKKYMRIIERIRDKDIAHAITAGYHDYEADILSERFMIVGHDGMFEFGVTKYNPYTWFDKELSHQFTYMLPIESPDDPENILARAWFFGTGRADCMGKGGMDCVRRDQVQWFKEESEKIPEYEATRGNGIAFMHHALQEHMMLVNDYPIRGQKRDYSTC